MGAYPITPREAFLTWCQQHTEVFTEQAAGIGLSTAEAELFSTTVSAATGALSAHANAMQLAKVSTVECNDQFAALRAVTGNTVRSIKAFAETQTKPSEIYNLAQIPPPSPPTPMPPPGQPTNLRVTIQPGNGRLTLTWKCENPSGSSNTTYLVRRKLPTDADFYVIGASGTKEYVDTTFMAGPDSVIYTIQAQRGTSEGPESDYFIINFGSQIGGPPFSTSVMARGGVNAGDAALVDAIVNSKANANGSMVMNGNGHAMSNGGRKGRRG